MLRDAGAGEFDWGEADCLIRHYYPSVGDPLAMPLAKFYRYYANVQVIDARRNGEDGGAAGVLRRLLSKAK